MDLREALTQITEIRQQLARTEVFRGYRSVPITFSAARFVLAPVHHDPEVLLSNRAVAKVSLVKRPAVLQIRAVDLAHMADFCTRSPVALAALLLAAGGASLRKAGAILLKASRAEPGEALPATSD